MNTSPYPLYVFLNPASTISLHGCAKRPSEWASIHASASANVRRGRDAAVRVTALRPFGFDVCSSLGRAERTRGHWRRLLLLRGSGRESLWMGTSWGQRVTTRTTGPVRLSVSSVRRRDGDEAVPVLARCRRPCTHRWSISALEPHTCRHVHCTCVCVCVRVVLAIRPARRSHPPAHSAALRAASLVTDCPA